MSAGIQPDHGVSAYDAVIGRRSVRRFLSDPVPDAVIDAVLAAASRAPSGQNMQPWFVHVVTGDAQARLSAAVTEAVKAGERSDEYDYFPKEIREPYRARRRKVGFDLFAIYGVRRDDLAGREQALLLNFRLLRSPGRAVLHDGARLGLWRVDRHGQPHDERHDGGARIRSCHLSAAGLGGIRRRGTQGVAGA